MQIYLGDEKAIDFMNKAMNKRGIDKKSKYLEFLIKRDANDLGLIKIEDLI